MSRLSRKPIEIPQSVKIRKEEDVIVVSGPKGEEKVPNLPLVSVTLSEKDASFAAEGGAKQARANVGTLVALFKNAIEGVTDGFSKVLEIEGVGYRATMEGKTLVLSLGFVNPVRFDPPEAVAIKIEKNVITVSGTSKGLVTQTAAQIRGFKKPEPYKGKGIHYQGEVIQRKVGKKAAAAKGAA